MRIWLKGMVPDITASRAYEAKARHFKQAKAGKAVRSQRHPKAQPTTHNARSLGCRQEGHSQKRIEDLFARVERNTAADK